MATVRHPVSKLLMRRIWMAVLGLSLGCASVPPRPAPLDPALLSEAESAVRDGCYDCLLEARTIYSTLAAGPWRAEVLQSLFETDLLVALREREFGLPSSGAVEEARVLVSELAPALEAGRFLELLDALPSEYGAWPRAVVRAFRTAHRDFTETVPDALVWLSGNGAALPVRTYLAMALTCVYRPRQPASGASDTTSDTTRIDDAPPLLQFRAAMCSGDANQVMQRVHAGTPRFAEAAYFLGLSALNALPAGGGPDPRPLIAEAASRFPASAAITYLSARLAQSLGRCSDAIALYGRVIESWPGHEDAWMGRTKCLTELGRRPEAIAAATQMVDGGFDNAAEGLYWRAWNRHQLGELDLARADIDAARRRQLNVPIVQLAGIIEHDQDDPDPAEADLKWVLQQNGVFCTARWYLGSVFVKRKDWADAAPAFDGARLCFGADADSRELMLANLQGNTRLDPEYRAARAAAVQSDIDDSRRQQRASALNAAKFFAAIGDLDSSRARLAMAGDDEALRSDIEDLRAWLDRQTSRQDAAP